jgi:hypothetical protein
MEVQIMENENKGPEKLDHEDKDNLSGQINKTGYNEEIEQADKGDNKTNTDNKSGGVQGG